MGSEAASKVNKSQEEKGVNGTDHIQRYSNDGDDKGLTGKNRNVGGGSKTGAGQSFCEQASEEILSRDHRQIIRVVEESELLDVKRAALQQLQQQQQTPSEEFGAVEKPLTVKLGRNKEELLARQEKEKGKIGRVFRVKEKNAGNFLGNHQAGSSVLQELETTSSDLVERPGGRHRDSDSSYPGAFPVEGIGGNNDNSRALQRDDEPSQPLESVDEEAGPFSEIPTQNEDVLIEAHLVESKSFKTTRGLSSRRTNSSSAAVLVNAKPLDGNLRWREILTSRKVLGLLMAIVLVAVAVGIAVGVTQGDGEKNEETTDLLSPTMEDRVEPFDVNLPPSTLNAIQIPDSPQARANRWMLLDENLHNYTKGRQRQRFALVTTFYATGGANWIDTGHWLRYDIGECWWGMRADLGEGYELDDDIYVEEDFEAVWQAQGEETEEEIMENLLGDDEDKVLACNDDGSYVNLVLVPNNLEGALPPELFMFLPDLELLDLSWNPLLVGSLPTQIGMLSQLDTMIFYDCSLMGTLPTELGHLPLSMMDLYHNKITGQIPSEFGLMSHLEVLSLDKNRLSGSIPSQLGQLESLLWLLIEHNDLTSSIPVEILRDGSNITEISLSGNEGLSGTLPTEINRLSDLANLKLANCDLSGTIPDISNLTLLQALDLSSQRFVGNVPTEIGLLTRLEQLDLEDNALVGTIPSELGLLGKLSVLALQENQLTGTLPSSFGQLDKLVTLDLSHNQLTGAIPSELGLLENLEEVILDDTLLTGAVPTELRELHDDGQISELAVNCDSIQCC